LQYASGHIWGGQETILRRLVVGDRKTGVAGINADTLLFSHSLGPELKWPPVRYSVALEGEADDICSM
jgi:hypothetical protein